ncbi:MAG TPA: hypothetical protein VF263_14680 [Longimicrobiaceae bacterium]
MPPQGPSPFVYFFQAAVLGAVLLYFAYGAVDRVGLETYQATARVTGKQTTPGSTTYHTNVVGGRALTQAERNPDVYMVTFELEGVATGGLVRRELYESLDADDPVHVRFQRTRLSKRILVTDLSR